jgi:hypothetical protein
MKRFIDNSYTWLGTTSDTASPLISTIHESSQQPLSLSPACCVSPSRSLETASNNGDCSLHALRSSLHSLPCKTLLKWLCLFLIKSRNGPHRKHSSSVAVSNCCIIKNLLPGNRNVFTEHLPRNGRCLQSHCLATGIYATTQSSQTFKYSFTLFTLCKESITRGTWRWRD